MTRLVDVCIAWQVFGKTMVCKDVDVATRVAHRDNLDGITMEGTQVSKKGVFKGGFHDVSRSVHSAHALSFLADLVCLIPVTGIGLQIYVRRWVYVHGVLNGFDLISI